MFSIRPTLISRCLGKITTIDKCAWQASQPYITNTNATEMREKTGSVQKRGKRKSLSKFVKT